MIIRPNPTCVLFFLSGPRAARQSFLATSGISTSFKQISSSITIGDKSGVNLGDDSSKLMSMSSSSTGINNDDQQQWIPNNPRQAEVARSKLSIWPLDQPNCKLLNQVHPLNYVQSTRDIHQEYDLIAIGAGAGGLVSSKQSARRGAKSAMISEHLAGGDCLNVGCVPSKALLSSAKSIRHVRRTLKSGILTGSNESTNTVVDFGAIMERMRKLRAKISPADGHVGTAGAGAHVFQGRGRFIGPNQIQVTPTSSSSSNNAPPEPIVLNFRKAVIATGGRPFVPPIPGLKEAPFTTNEVLFNMETLPPRMIILGAGVIALEMAQTFATFGSKVTVINRSSRLFEAKGGDTEAAQLIQSTLEQEGVQFLSKAKITKVETLREANSDDDDALPLMRVSVSVESKESGENKKIIDEQLLECECLVVAAGRVANVQDLGLDKAGVDHDDVQGILVNDLAQSVSNPNVYAVGDAVAGVPRLTHMSGEMAKQVVQNALFDDSWKLGDFVVPAVMYTEPEYATVGIASVEKAAGIVDVYRAGLEHNDRAILESENEGFCKILCQKGTDKIVGATIVAPRAGEMINEITLAMKHNVGLRGIGRNVHAYPTTGEAVMGCGLQCINKDWTRLN